MAEWKRIVVNLPASVVREIDGLLTLSRLNRSQLIYEAVKLHLPHLKGRLLREKLKQGYLDMAAINLALAEEALHLAGDEPEFPVELPPEAFGGR